MLARVAKPRRRPATLEAPPPALRTSAVVCELVALAYTATRANLADPGERRALHDAVQALADRLNPRRNWRIEP